MTLRQWPLAVSFAPGGGHDKVLLLTFETTPSQLISLAHTLSPVPLTLTVPFIQIKCMNYVLLQSKDKVLTPGTDDRLTVLYLQHNSPLFLLFLSLVRDKESHCTNSIAEHERVDFHPIG